jgi:ATP-binding cassette subfamily B protein
MAFFEEQSTGGLMSVLNDDVNQLERFLDVGANEIIQLITTIVVVIGGFLIAAPSVAWLTVVPIPFIVYGSLKFQRGWPRATPPSANRWASSTASAPTTSAASPPSRATPPRPRSRARRGGKRPVSPRNAAAIRLSSAFVPLIRMVIMSGFIAIMVFGGLLVIKGNSTSASTASWCS